MASTPSSVSALLKPRANVGRNAFPLDHKQVFSIKAGQITPVKCMHFIPNDYFDINTSEFCITFPMNTAPFLRGRKETAFYSVYYSAIWSLYNQYQATRIDNKTSAFGSQPRLVEPRISKFDLYKWAYFQFIGYMYWKYYIDVSTRVQFPNVDETEILGRISAYRSNWLNEVSSDVERKPVINNFGSAPFDSLYNWYVHYKTDNPQPRLSNKDWFQDVVGHFRAYSVVRKLDMLGYGNLCPWFKEIDNHLQKLVEATESWTSDSLQVFLNNANTAFSQLAQRIQSITSTYTNPATTGLPTSTSEVTLEYLNLYPICAYNLIFYHFFRNSFYDLNYDPNDFNLDFVSVDRHRPTNIVRQEEFSPRFLDIEYHQWKKDTFTAVLPDTQFGAVSEINISSIGDIDIQGSATLNGTTGTDQNRWKNYDGTSMLSSQSVETNATGQTLRTASPQTPIIHDHLITGSASISSVGSASLDGSFDVIALKRAEMLQDYRQTLMRAGNKTSDIFTALYGGAPSSEHEDDIIPRFLDTFGEDVFVDPVTATANTEQGENGTLGDLSSRGKFQGNSGHIKFNAGNNFGCILMLTYFVPTAEYNSYVIDRHVCELTPEEHYISNFENYGLEPVYTDELNALIGNNKIAVRGYAPRYHHKKSQVDMVHGEFCSLPLHLRVLRNNSWAGVFSRGRSTDLSGFFGEFNVWVAPRTDMQARSVTQLRDFYVNPSVLDNIFKFACGADQGTDQVLCNVYIDWQSTRGMSKVGLINFV